MARVAGRADIYPVFRELFARQTEKGPRHERTTPERRAAAPPPALLFDGAEWDFATMQRVYEAMEDIALQRTRPRRLSQPDRDDLGRADARRLFLGRHAADVRALVLRQAFRARRDALPQGLSGARLRDRHQFQPLHQLLHGGEHDGDADAGASPTPPSATTISSRTTICSSNGRTPAGILDYLDFAKRYVAACEERHGLEAVEATLDAAHALMDQGVFRYRRAAQAQARRIRAPAPRAAASARRRTIATSGAPCPARRAPREPTVSEQEARERKQRLRLPEENLLYFLEKNSPVLDDWQRELLRIVRNLAQYFYPQRQTKLMNEGCATFVHYTIVNRLYDKGLISEGALLEILHSHSNVVAQSDFDDPRYGGINPYALGFAMMQDIQRICVAPTDEDRDWFPDIAGRDDWRGALRDVWANYRDESFVRQFLSPHLIRKLQIVRADRQGRGADVRVDAIHDDDGYRRVRSTLADSYDVGRQRARHPGRRRRPARRSPNSCCATRRATGVRARGGEPRASAAPHPQPVGLRRAPRGDERRRGRRLGLKTARRAADAHFAPNSPPKPAKSTSCSRRGEVERAGGAALTLDGLEGDDDLAPAVAELTHRLHRKPVESDRLAHRSRN